MRACLIRIQWLFLSQFDANLALLSWICIEIKKRYLSFGLHTSTKMDFLGILQQECHLPVAHQCDDSTIFDFHSLLNQNHFRDKGNAANAKMNIKRKMKKKKFLWNHGNSRSRKIPYYHSSKTLWWTWFLAINQNNRIQFQRSELLLSSNLYHIHWNCMQANVHPQRIQFLSKRSHHQLTTCLDPKIQSAHRIIIFVCTERWVKKYTMSFALNKFSIFVSFFSSHFWFCRPVFLNEK